MKKANIDEILELVWTEDEYGRNSVNDLLMANKGIRREAVDKLSKDGYLDLKDEKLAFTDKGRRKAAGIIRYHRLAERLLRDVLEMKSSVFEPQACRFEHILSAEVADAICTLLGHPRECPHGRRIPPGECCRKAVKEISSLISPLTELAPSQGGAVAYITTAHHSRLDRLTSLGIFPGVRVRLHQKFPTFVVQIEEMQIALDRDIAEDIFIRRG